MADKNLHDFALEEFNNIVNGISDENFYKTLSQKEGNVNWMKVYNLFKTEFSSEVNKIWNQMWEEENLADKINTIKRIKRENEDRTDKNWRPITGDITSQVLNLDIILHRNIRDHYVELMEKEEAKVAKLKEELTVEWENLKKHQRTIENAQEKNKKLCKAIVQNMEFNREVISQLNDVYFN